MPARVQRFAEIARDRANVRPLAAGDCEFELGVHPGAYLDPVHHDQSRLEFDLLAGAQKQAEFLALNPFGQVPVLVDGDEVIADSNAILASARAARTPRLGVRSRSALSAVAGVASALR